MEKEEAKETVSLQLDEIAEESKGPETELETSLPIQKFIEHYADSPTNSLEAHQRELENIKEFDKRATQAENDLKRAARQA